MSSVRIRYPAPTKENMNEPSEFKQQWEARKLLKRAKKKAKKQLEQKGFSSQSASRMVKQAVNNIANKPERKNAGRGG